MQVFYWMSGFSQEADRYFFYWLFMELMVLFCTVLGQTLAVICPTEEVAQLVATTFLPLVAVFSGFIIPPKRSVLVVVVVVGGRWLIGT